MKRLLLLIMMTLATSVALAADGETPACGLPELYRLALERAETIRIAEIDLAIAKNYKKAAFSALLPKVSAYDNYSRYAKENVLQPEWVNTWGGLLNYTFTINGRELLAFGIAEDNITSREQQLRQARASYLFMVAATYFEALKAGEMAAAAAQNLERLEAHKTAVESRLRLGELTRPDLYRVEAETSSARADLTEARNARYLAESSLGRLVGLEGDFTIVPPAESTETRLADRTLRDLQGLALSERADLQALKTAEKMAQSQIKLEKSAYWPTVSLEGGYTSTRTDKMDLIEMEEDSAYGQVTINVPIFDGGLRKANKGTAEAELEQARLARERLEKDIVVEVEQAWRDLFSRQQREAALADKLAFARENFGAVSRQFEHGLATSIDRIDANTLLTQATRELAAAAYDRAAAALRLEKVAGTFLETVMQDPGDL